MSLTGCVSPSRPKNKIAYHGFAVLAGCKLPAACGAVAQLGERRVRNAKVGSSILLGSTTLNHSIHAGTGKTDPALRHG